MHSFSYFFRHNLYQALFFIGLVLTTTANAQFSYTKLIEKGKVEKAFEKAQKSLEKMPTSPQALFDISTLYALQETPHTDLPQAYSFAVQAKKEFVALPPKEQAKLAKNGLNLTTLSTNARHITEELYAYTQRINTLQGYNNFIMTYSYDSHITQQAIEARNHIAFLHAQNRGTIEAFNSFLHQYPNAHEEKQALFKRDSIAFYTAKEKASIEALTAFLDTYPHSQFTQQALQIRDSKAFTKAQKENTVESYQNFIDSYPTSTYLPIALKKRDAVAFSSAEIAHTVEAFQNFVITYPQSSLKDSAIYLRDSIAFSEALYKDSLAAYSEFVTLFPQSSFTQQAKDSIVQHLYSEGINEQSAISLKQFITAFPNHPKTAHALQILINKCVESNQIMLMWWLLYTHYDEVLEEIGIQTAYEVLISDGGYPPIPEEFDEIYTYDDTTSHYRATRLEEMQLFMTIGVTRDTKKIYEHFITMSTLPELSFLALQRLIEQPLMTKKYGTALQIAKRYKKYFHSFKKYTDLINLLAQKKISVSISKVKGVNTSYDEYNPIPSYDGKHLYYGSINPKKGLGGEDIFIADKQGKSASFVRARVMKDLSSRYSNEVPLSISADGTSMLLWDSDNGGDIYISHKTTTGWSAPKVLPDPINTEYFEGDAIFTADGKSIIFTSARNNDKVTTYNTHYDSNPEGYHGSNEYPTDLYICTKDSNDIWGDVTNLGPEINTPYSERTPFLHPDGKTLYFSSDGHGGMGRMDVFMSKRESEHNWYEWSSPTNLGKEINTPANDWGFKFTTDGKYAYYSSKITHKQKSRSLTFVLDVSGSMAGEKLRTMKESALNAIRTALANNMEVAIFPFPDFLDNGYILPFTTNYAEIEEYINDLRAGGYTPLYEALIEANSYTKTQHHTTSQHQSIVVMTDGEANGDLEFDSFMQLLGQKRPILSHSAIALELNENLETVQHLKLLTSNTRGKLHMVYDYNDLGVTFANITNDQLEITTSTSSRDIYRLKVPKHIKPEVVATIQGKLLDSNNKPIQATLRWENLETGEIVGEAKSDPVTGAYFIALPMGKQYGYFIDDDQFFPISDNLDLRNSTTAQTVKKDITIPSLSLMEKEGIAAPINNLFFAINQATLLRASLPELKRIAQVIIKQNLKVEVGGHTDNTGTAEYNMALSIKRATAVTNYLISLGVPQSLIITKGYGDTAPIADNTTIEGKAQNRRVELIFIQ